MQSQNNKGADIRRTIAHIEWKDLRHLNKFQIGYNLLLPYPFLFLSWWLVSQSLYLLACAATYLFFASAFRQAHDAYHHSLGVSKRTNTIILMILSVLLFTGLHSIRATHMQHHRDPLGDDDIEGSLAKESWYKALLGGVQYRFAIYKRGMQLSSPHNRFKAWIEFAMITLAILIIGVLTLYSLRNNFANFNAIQVAVYHLTTMMLANASMGIVAVWAVHHDTEHTIARTERNRLVNLLTFGLLFHVEHHLYPSIPTNNLPELAKRLDTEAPHLTRLKVIPTLSEGSQFVRNYFTKLLVGFNNNDNNDKRNCPLRSRFA